MSHLTPQQVPRTPEAGDLRLLLAEDSEAIRLVVRAELERLTCVRLIAEAANSEEALDLFFRLRPDVVLVSVRFPPHGGFQVLQRIKEVSSDCTVILTTCEPNPFVEKTGRLFGAEAVWSAIEDVKQIAELLLRLHASRPLRDPHSRSSVARAEPQPPVD